MQTANKTIDELDSYSKTLHQELFGLAIPSNPDTKSRAEVTSILRSANEFMTRKAFDYLNEHPFSGNKAKSLFCKKTDVLVTTVFELVHYRFHPLPSRSKSQSLSLVCLLYTSDSADE